jgi:hypothetical protein
MELRPCDPSHAQVWIAPATRAYRTVFPDSSSTASMPALPVGVTAPGELHESPGAGVAPVPPVCAVTKRSSSWKDAGSANPSGRRTGVGGTNPRVEDAYRGDGPLIDDVGPADQRDDLGPGLQAAQSDRLRRVAALVRHHPWS